MTSAPVRAQLTPVSCISSAFGFGIVAVFKALRVFKPIGGRCRCDGVKLSKLEDLVDVAGGADLGNLLPDDVSSRLGGVAGKLSLEGIQIKILDGYKVGLASLTIGIPDLNANVLPCFEIKSLKTMFTATKPFDAVRSISCALGGSDDYRGAPFDISLSLPDVTAASSFTGTTSLKLSSLFSQVGVTSPDDLPNLAVNAMQLYASKLVISDSLSRLRTSPPGP